MRCSLRRVVVRLAVAGTLCCAGCSATDRLTEARRYADAATNLMREAQELFQQGQADAANRTAENAQESMRLARDAYLAAKADRSRDVDLLIEFAELTERLEDSDLAGEAYARAAEIDGARPDLWYKAARNFVEARGRYLDLVMETLAKAEAASTGAAAPVPRADIEAVRGDVFLALGLPEDAAPHYEASLAENAQQPRARIGIAGAALQLGDVERSAALVDSFAQPTPAEAVLLDRTLRGSYMAFRRDRVIVPETAASQRALAKICVRLGFVQESLLAVESAVRLDPADVYSWNMLGSLSAQAGDTQRAREAFTQSLTLAPDQPRTKQALDELGGAAN